MNKVEVAGGKFIVIVDENEGYVDYKVIQIESTYDDGTPAEKSHYANITVKFDGCWNLNFNPGDVLLHFCHWERDMEYHFSLLRAVLEHAKEYFGE